MSHVHSFRLFQDDIYLCNHPSCFIKWRIRALDGKVAECPICHSGFIVSQVLVDKEQMFLLCENCKAIKNLTELTYTPCTIPELHARMEIVARETYKRVLDNENHSIKARLAALEQKEEELKKRQVQFGLLVKEFQAKSNAIDSNLAKRAARIEARFLTAKRIIAERKAGIPSKKTRVKEIDHIGESIEALLRGELGKL